MTGPKPYKAVLKEQPLAEDATSNQPDQLPTYNAWSADGDVTGELVFVNYGLPSDYDILDKLGIDVKGKIVIAKYGRSWRGIKPKVAQEHGAIGCIIYSDPKDDGYYQGDVYPKGSFKMNMVYSVAPLWIWLFTRETPLLRAWVQQRMPSEFPATMKRLIF